MVPPGGFHFNINGLLVCEPYFISNNVLALAACLFYFPTTMILMYCYGTIFHSDKVKVRYKKAVLTSLPFVRASGGSEENANKMAERVRFFFLIWHDGLPGYQTTFFVPILSLLSFKLLSKLLLPRVYYCLFAFP